jgi:hypothetical protein
MPTVRRIVRKAKADNYRFSAIVLGIANSDQFRFARPPSASGATSEAVVIANRQ